MKKQIKKKIIAILGGMGPQVSAYLLDVIIDLSIKKFGTNNDDFPEILLDSIPIPDFISNDSRKMESLKILRNRVRFLNIINPSCLVIACNTAHIFLDDLRKISKAPFVSIIEEVVDAVVGTNLKRVGILGTPMTMKYRLYQKALRDLNIRCIEPKNDELKILEKIIRNVIAGLSDNNDNRMLVSITNNLMKRGAQGIILGCTELPLIFPAKQNFPVFSSLNIIAKALLEKGGNIHE